MSTLTASNLAVQFGDTTIFSGASFDVGPKDKIGLIGVNGAGKTTLFRLLTRQESPSQGGLFCDKETVLTPAPKAGKPSSTKCSPSTTT